MMLIELKYIVVVVCEWYFGCVVEVCFVSQLMFLVVIKKFEDEFNVQIFECGVSEVSVMLIGDQIVIQVQCVLEQIFVIKEIVKQGKDLFVGLFCFGVIYMIGLYLLLMFVKQMIQCVLQMLLMLQENYMLKLFELLKQGEIDVVIMVLLFFEIGLMVWLLYDELFVVVLLVGYLWEKCDEIDVEDLKQEIMLLFGNGYCFCDYVFGVCLELMCFLQMVDGIQKIFEGLLFEIICYMVVSGVGIMVLLWMLVVEIGLCVNGFDVELLLYVLFNELVFDWCVVFVWCKSFMWMFVIDVISDVIFVCELFGVVKFDMLVMMN